MIFKPIKIYTKSGDKGKTSLFNGVRVEKSNELIDLLGFLDEINAKIGQTLALYNFEMLRNKKYQRVDDQIEILKEVQNILFEIGAEVANPQKHGQLNLETFITQIEHKMDFMQENTPFLTNFILPTGSIFSTQLHVLRSFIRRVERKFVNSSKVYSNESVIKFLNRLSDYIFILTRYYNFINKIKERLWKKNNF